MADIERTCTMDIGVCAWRPGPAPWSAPCGAALGSHVHPGHPYVPRPCGAVLVPDGTSPCSEEYIWPDGMHVCGYVHSDFVDPGLSPDSRIGTLQPHRYIPSRYVCERGHVAEEATA